jgi:double-stranded uracil-DNA glycosylase
MSTAAQLPQLPLQLPPLPSLAYGLPPIENPAARVLILGSMPGIASLRARQYYAHPRNQFWPIMGQLLSTELTVLSYSLRVQSLITAGLALWDVLQACQRPGSLDADIAPASIVANDFAAFFQGHPAISHVYFNGAAAAQYFNRHVQPQLTQRALIFQRLPSTSPAHAGMNFQTKLAAWRAITDILGQTC